VSLVVRDLARLELHGGRAARADEEPFLSLRCHLQKSCPYRRPAGLAVHGADRSIPQPQDSSVDLRGGALAERRFHDVQQVKEELVGVRKPVDFDSDDLSLVADPEEKSSALGVEKGGDGLERRIRHRLVDEVSFDAPAEGGLELAVLGLAASNQIHDLGLRGVRPTREKWILAGKLILIILTAMGSIRLFGHLRMLGAQGAAERGEALIEAIDRFQAREGRLPGSLDELVPRDLPSIPETGMMGFRSFEYVGPASETAGEERLFETYEIRVNLYQLLQFDSLVYWPEENYPDWMYGGGVERIGEWAYVHE